MRQIKAEAIAKEIARLSIEANTALGWDVREAIACFKEKEKSETPRSILGMILENADLAYEKKLPICQDTGMAVVFVYLGQEVCITGGSIEEAIFSGVREGYSKGYLRKSVVRDPIDRVNTNDNAPAVIHYFIVPGDELRIIVAPKGFGSENMSAVKMLKPSDGIEGVKDFIVETVKLADANPCPPIIAGVGVGGTMEKAAIMSKTALLRRIGERNPDKMWAEVEEELLGRINSLGIGPAGLGGLATALAVHIEAFATHIAGLPVAVNIGCHATRHSEVTL
ncbi:MAG: fumarate hydratase [Clostridiales bacterium]|nr:fumarate hydratase [Clostridiales bacterium]